MAAGHEEGMFWQRPWRLRAAVVYGWRAHRQRLTAIATHPNASMVATAGRGHVGGQDQDVVRCWNLADAAAGLLSMLSPTCACSMLHVTISSSSLQSALTATNLCVHVTAEALLCSNTFSVLLAQHVAFLLVALHGA